ncbi:MAG: CDP-diacylglycerol--serine O-phosphatidyltransferase [Crenarchaeota archaeon]|nr:CDP-diacylglycerol--serine O-phosphatidyltransferase [Thermoproteota archaeon]
MGVTIRKGGVKFFFTIPNIFTLSNVVSGFIAIYFASVGDYLTSFLFITLAIIFDGADGFIARKLGAASDFGRELDSLCDEVSFGVAPAFLLVRITVDKNPQLTPYAIIIGAIFASFGALRLARFNLFGSKEYFEGLAITGAALFGGLIINCIYPLSPAVALALMLAAAFLMISSISFPSTKTRAGIKSVLVSVIIGILCFGVYPMISLLLDPLQNILWLLLSAILGYIVVSPIVFKKMLGN